MSEARNAVLNTGRNEAENYKSKHRTKELLNSWDTGGIVILIVYIVKNFSDAEHTISPKEVQELMCEIFGTGGVHKDENDDAIYAIPSDKQILRYMQGISDFSTLYTYFGDDDCSAQVIRRFLGGSVVKIRNKQRYYFKSDYDVRDFDVIRIFTDRNTNRDLPRTLIKKDTEYIRELCDNISPPQRTKSGMKFASIVYNLPQDLERTWAKFLNRIGGGKKGDLKEIHPLTDGFFNTYHFISDALEKGQELTIKWKDIAADTNSGNSIEGRLKPKRFIWKKNWFCVECEKLQEQSHVTIRINDIIDVYRCDQNK